MRKLLIGPSLLGIGWLAGSYYGADAEQLVHKSPDDTYAGIEHAVDAIPPSGMTNFDDGTPMPYEVHVERTPGRQLIMHVLFGGREGGSTEFDFTAQGGGNSTMVVAKAHGDRAVLQQALAGTSKARLAYAPDWMLNLLTVRPMLQQMAASIEAGQHPVFLGIAQANSGPPDAGQQQAQDADDSDPTAPTVDPDADARKYGAQPR